MDVNFNCKFCNRDVRTIGQEHYRNDLDNTVICKDCGISKQAEEQIGNPPYQNPANDPANDPTVRYVSLEGFLSTVPEILQERLKQMVKYGYSSQHDSHHSLGDFLVFIERYLRKAQDMYTSPNPQHAANARKELVKIIALGMAYLESHPLPQ